MIKYKGKIPSSVRRFVFFIFCNLIITPPILHAVGAFSFYQSQVVTSYDCCTRIDLIRQLHQTRFVDNACSHNRNISNKRRGHFVSSVLFSSNGNNNKLSGNKPKGVYSRPSAAIEKGSGFYIPGLEGSRVRLLFGILAIALSYVNHNVATSAIGASQQLSELITSVFGVLLILQALIEFGKETGFGVSLDDGVKVNGIANSDGGASDKASTSGMAEIISKDISNSETETLRWIAASYISLTPATHFLCLQRDDGSHAKIYSLGGLDSGDSNNDGDKEAISSAISTVFDSKGGRVSLPNSHPATLLLPEEFRRCVLLQRVESSESDSQKKQSCFLIGSNQLLPSFTKGDLSWLGQLAIHYQLLQKS